MSKHQSSRYWNVSVATGPRIFWDLWRTLWKSL